MSFVLVDFRLDGFSDLSSLRTHFRAAYCMYCMRLLYVDMRSHCLLRNWRFQVPKNLRNDLSQRRPAIIVCRWSGICGSTLRIGRREGSSFAIWRGPFVENGAHSFAIEPQTESAFATVASTSTIQTASNARSRARDYSSGSRVRVAYREESHSRHDLNFTYRSGNPAVSMVRPMSQMAFIVESLMSR